MSNLNCQNCPSKTACAFNLLTPQELDLLNDVKKLSYLKRGDVLNQIGTPIDGIFCIATGYAKIIWPSSNASGEESIIKIASPGDMTGYRCLFSEKTYRATAVALEDTIACFVPQKLFFDLLSKNSQFNFEILKRMGLEIKKSEQRLQSFCIKNVRERLAESLIHFSNIAGIKINHQQTRIQIKLTREELASYLGAAKETVIRTISEFKDDGILTQQDNYLVILNSDKLKEAANL